MARLYPLDPVPAVDAPEGHFEPEEDGGYDLPDTLFSRLHSTHHGGEKAWETQVERQRRQHYQDLERRRDPAALFDAVDRFAGAFGQAADRLASGSTPQDRDEEIAALRARLAELESAEPGDEPAAGRSAARRKPQPSKEDAPAE